MILLFINAKLLNRATFNTLFSSQTIQRSCFAISLVICFFWSVKAGLLNGLNIHILAMTAITLIMGVRFAMVCANLALCLLVLFNAIELKQLASYALFTAAIPILFSYFIFSLSYRYLAKHIFVYIFVCAFLGAGFTAVCHILLMTMYHYLIGSYSLVMLLDNYSYFAALIWFPESMLSGMAMTVLIIYRPHWVKTFYDNQYLDHV